MILAEKECDWHKRKDCFVGHDGMLKSQNHVVRVDGKILTVCFDALKEIMARENAVRESGIDDAVHSLQALRSSMLGGYFH
jgi:hypothetical protein